MDGTVLIADDDRTIRTVLTQALTRAGCKVHATASIVTLMRWVEEGRGDAVISDVAMPDGNGLEQLPRIAELRPGLPVVVISAQNTILTAIKAAEADAFDYLPKPFDLPDLMKRVSKALEVRRQNQTTAQDRPRPDHALPLVGQSAPMQALYKLVAQTINLPLSVLITGESGSGKSLLARALHDLSDRRSAPFVVALPEALDDLDSRAAILARAEKGTLLLEEVGDLSAGAQAWLSHQFENEGPAAPRILATSLEPLDAGLENGAFRQDLYFRLSGVVIALPPLRERIDDLGPLMWHFFQLSEAEGLNNRQVSADALALLRRYRWPGNVRQLANTVRRLSVGRPNEPVSASEVAGLLSQQPVTHSILEDNGEDGLSAEVEKHLRLYFDRHGDLLPPSGLYGRIVREIEAPLLQVALDATGGNQAKCAELLGINRNTLRKKLSDLEIRVTRRRKMM